MFRLFVLSGTLLLCGLSHAEQVEDLSALNAKQNWEVDQAYTQLNDCVDKIKNRTDAARVSSKLQECYQNADKKLMQINQKYSDLYHYFLQQKKKEHSLASN